MRRATFNSTVRGTIDNPPVIVEQEGSVYFEPALAAPLITAAVIFKASAAGYPTTALAGILLVGVFGTALFAFKFFWPDTLRVSADGLLVRTGFVLTRFRWCDFSHFDRDFGETNTVVGIFGEKNHQGRLPGEARGLALFATEEQSEDFLTLLRTAQVKWGRAHSEDAVSDSGQLCR